MNPSRFEMLFSPITIGKLELKNRLLRSTHEARFPVVDNCVTEQYRYYYEARAKGGYGLVNVEAADVSPPLGLHGEQALRINDDKYVKRWSELVDAIHRHGAKTFLQLHHYGQWHESLRSGLAPISASPLPRRDTPTEQGGLLPREITVDEIEELIDKFALSTEYAAKAGFDGIEINCAGSHLLASFLSRVFNKRQDAYGCTDLESRSRFVVNIIKEIKKRLGQDFPLSVIMNGMEYGDPESTTIEESQGFARIFQQAGADAIVVRFWWNWKVALWPDLLYHTEPESSLPKELDWSNQGAGAFAPLAAAIKKVVSVPVITVGRYDAALAEKVLREGKADMVALGRRTIADPDYAAKVASGRLEDIRPCTGCLFCIERMTSPDGLGLRCQVNASIGKEREYEIREAAEKKRVLIIGGGPAGMEAARVASARGHEVTLYEEAHKLGGSVPLAEVVKGPSEDLDALIRYFQIQLEKSGVKVTCGEEGTAEAVRKLKPDILVLAAGGLYTTPEIPGIDKPNVVNIAELNRSLKRALRLMGPQRLRQLTNVWMPLGKRVVIMGGRIQGVQLAEFLADRGRQVTIVETGSGSDLADMMQIHKKGYLLGRLAEKGVRTITEATYQEVTDNGLVILKDGQTRLIEADSIVPALPLKPNTEIMKRLGGEAAQVHAIGSCIEPGLTEHAIRDGARIGHAI